MVAHTIKAEYPEAQSFKTRLYGVVAAVLFVAIAVSQLIGFEEMRTVFSAFWPAGLGWAVLPLAAVIVVSEVLAIPFLLGMRLSPLMRFVSFFCGILVIIFLAFSSLQAFIVRDLNSGVFGSYVTAADGVTLTLFTLIVTWLFLRYSFQTIRS